MTRASPSSAHALPSASTSAASAGWSFVRPSPTRPWSRALNTMRSARVTGRGDAATASTVLLGAGRRDRCRASAGDRGRAGGGRQAPRDARRRVGVELVERLPLEQGLGERVELVAVLAQQRDDLRMGGLDDAPDLLVDQPLRRRRGRAVAAGVVRRDAVAREHGHRAYRVAHAPAAGHLARELGELLDVGFGTGALVDIDALL